MKFRFPFKCVAFDLETTDVNPDLGSIIQIGAVYLDKELNVLREFNQMVKPLDGHFNPKARAVNKITDEMLKDARPLTQALGLFETFCGDSAQLCSWGVHFDIPFLRKQYEKIKRSYHFSYRYLDLKSIAIWEMARRGTPLVSGVERFLKYNKLKFDGKPHDALSDIKNVVKMLRFFLEQ